MVVDSSVIVAIALLEDNWQDLYEKVQGSAAITAAPTLLESHIVLSSRLGDDAERALEAVIRGLAVELIPFGKDHLIEACKAFDRFGKGRHPAALNFGDCISYALSKLSGHPILFVGDDFAQTDLVRV